MQQNHVTAVYNFSELTHKGIATILIKKIKSSLYSRYFAEACNECRGPFSRLGAWGTQLQRNVAAVASGWRHCADLTDPEFQPQIYRTDSVCAKQLSLQLFCNYFDNAGNLSDCIIIISTCQVKILESLLSCH